MTYSLNNIYDERVLWQAKRCSEKNQITHKNRVQYDKNGKKIEKSIEIQEIHWYYVYTKDVMFRRDIRRTRQIIWKRSKDK